MPQALGIPFLSKAEFADICPMAFNTSIGVSPWKIGQGPLPGEFNEMTL